MSELLDLDATAIAQSVREGRATARTIVSAALDRIAARDPGLNGFTATFPSAALAAAEAVDRKVAAGEDPGALAGVPFAVKNLFDVAGVVTIAGSKILRDEPPAACDATVVARLKSAGGILVGATNMDEFAYGFTTENAHYGPTRNPHDPARSAGGSSGGSAVAVAAGMAPLALGTDTNGSIRVPASLCGVFGLKPTLGRLSRAGVYPFVHELDHVGPFARSVRDLALAYDLMQGPDSRDPMLAGQPNHSASPGLDRNIAGLRVGGLGGWFRDGAAPEVLDAVDRVAEMFGGVRMIELADVAEARAAAFCMTAASGAALHLEALRTRPQDFDPATRDRFFAGALLPQSVVDRARRLRERFRDQLRRVFEEVDILIAPATPCAAPLLGQATLRLGEREVPLRPNLGLYTQPLSFIGLPVVVVPLRSAGTLPIGVQLVALAWREDIALGAAAMLERAGITDAGIAER